MFSLVSRQSVSHCPTQVQSKDKWVECEEAHFEQRADIGIYSKNKSCSCCSTQPGMLCGKDGTMLSQWQQTKSWLVLLLTTSRLNTGLGAAYLILHAHPQKLRHPVVTEV